MQREASSENWSRRLSDRTHAREITGYEGRIGELAGEIGRLTYDQVSNFLGVLAIELVRQADGDRQRGRKRLASELEAAASGIDSVKSHIDNAWLICLPYMKSEELPSSE